MVGDKSQQNDGLWHLHLHRCILFALGRTAVQKQRLAVDQHYAAEYGRGRHRL
jgi:hypothetical protein